MKIRLAKEQDSASLLEIYGPYIKDTSVSFEYEVPSVSEFAKRIQGVTEKYPWLVCEYDREIVGYAYASKHRERAAYQWSVDVSVYINPNYHRMHIATALYTALTELLKLQGYYNAYAGITSPNAKSEGFHQSFGFEPIAVYHNVGYKFDIWHDVRWFELALSEYSKKPEAPKAITELTGTKQYEEIIENAVAIIKKR
ncbi:MAG: N-acetyltransferase family protein [Caulobacteraceae bacterium]